MPIFSLSSSTLNKAGFPTLQVRAEHWLGAFREAMRLLGREFDPADLVFSLQADGGSAQIDLRQSGERFLLSRLEEATPDGAKEAEAAQMAKEAETPKAASEAMPQKAASDGVFPTPKKRFLESFQMEGKYQPGVTTDMMTDAFMRMAALYDHFGADQKGALAYLFSVLEQSMQWTGGGLLCTDIDDPEALLRWRIAVGPVKEQIMLQTIRMGQGLLGYCALEGVSLHIADCTRDARAKGEVLLSHLPSLGAMICAPLVYQSQLCGVIYLYREGGAAPFTLGEKNILDYFAAASAEYLGQSRET
jgi:GAF domain-containing protein